MRTFTLPDLGEGLENAEIVSWYVSVGDVVVADQPLVSVETDKAVMDIPAPWSGQVAKLYGDVGDIIDTGAPLVDFIDASGETTFTGIVGSSDDGDAETPKAPAPPRKRPAPDTTIVQATPAVRALAKRLGVDLSTVVATGPGSLVTAEDVERTASPEASGSDADAGYKPLRGFRRTMAEHMARSGREVVPATLMDEVDVDAWVPGTDATVRLIRAIVVACAAEPALNAWLQAGAEGRRVHEHVDLGVAVDTQDGLFVPVIRRVDTLDGDQVRGRLDELIGQVRDRSIAAEDLRGATITLSNFGSLGSRHAMLVVVPPQVAILGAGRAAPRPVAVDGEVVVHRILPLSLTVDHRAVVGGEAARFMAAAAADLATAE